MRQRRQTSKYKDWGSVVSAIEVFDQNIFHGCAAHKNNATDFVAEWEKTTSPSGV
ncbi:MAG TPA: hypothetical protein PLD99_00155 [Parcubacteria group bacterium]|nr:hypothetical protein [Parcubacteria group bacterium]